MDKLVKEYYSYLEADKKASLNTVSSYKRDIDKFCQYITDLQIKNIKSVAQTDILNYLLYLQKQGKSASTVSRSLSSVKSLYRYLFSKGLVKANPTDDIHGFKPDKRPPKALTDVQIDTFLNAPALNSIKGFRDKAILEIMYATGMRATDIIKLRLSDINLNIGYIFCRNKDKKERVVPIYSLARDSVKNYVEKRKRIKNSDKTDILFLNLNGEPLSRQGLWKIVKAYKEQSGMNVEITPNTIRDSFAIHMLENGADLKSVQEMLGHSDISSTRVYEQVIKNKLTEVYEKAHPRAKKLANN